MLDLSEKEIEYYDGSRDICRRQVSPELSTSIEAFYEIPKRKRRRVRLRTARRKQIRRNKIPQPPVGFVGRIH